MTKKGHQKFWPLKWNFFKRHLGQRKNFSPSQTRRQVSATGPVLDVTTEDHACTLNSDKSLGDK